MTSKNKTSVIGIELLMTHKLERYLLDYQGHVFPNQIRMLQEKGNSYYLYVFEKDRAVISIVEGELKLTIESRDPKEYKMLKKMFPNMNNWQIITK